MIHSGTELHHCVVFVWRWVNSLFCYVFINFCRWQNKTM